MLRWIFVNSRTVSMCRLWNIANTARCTMYVLHNACFLSFDTLAWTHFYLEVNHENLHRFSKCWLISLSPYNSYPTEPQICMVTMGERKNFQKMSENITPQVWSAFICLRWAMSCLSLKNKNMRTLKICNWTNRFQNDTKSHVGHLFHYAKYTITQSSVWTQDQPLVFTCCPRGKLSCTTNPCALNLHCKSCSPWFVDD